MLRNFLQQGRGEHPQYVLLSLLVISLGMGLIDLPLRASNQSLPVLATYPIMERPRLPFAARIERAHSYRGRSASKEGTWPLPPHSSEAARGASKGIVSATPPIFQQPCQVCLTGLSQAP